MILGTCLNFGQMPKWLFKEFTDEGDDEVFFFGFAFGDEKCDCGQRTVGNFRVTTHGKMVIVNREKEDKK